MPMANGLYVQVYLMGYRQACDPKANPNFNNVSLAKNLGVPLSDVINAWKYWEQKNIVKMHKNRIAQLKVTILEEKKDEEEEHH